MEVRVQDIQGKSLVIVNHCHSLNSVDLLHLGQGSDPESNLYFVFTSIISSHTFDCSLLLQAVLFEMANTQCSVYF